LPPAFTAKDPEGFGAAPTASGLQVRCAGRLRVHRCEPSHEQRGDLHMFCSLLVLLPPPAAAD
jgi:hypothetical protein